MKRRYSFFWQFVGSDGITNQSQITLGFYLLKFFVHKQVLFRDLAGLG
jgi:hypothetical protein